MREMIDDDDVLVKPDGVVRFGFGKLLFVW
jgi:hypothetical protein